MSLQADVNQVVVLASHQTVRMLLGAAAGLGGSGTPWPRGGGADCGGGSDAVGSGGESRGGGGHP